MKPSKLLFGKYWFKYNAKYSVSNLIYLVGNFKSCLTINVLGKILRLSSQEKHNFPHL